MSHENDYEDESGHILQPPSQPMPNYDEASDPGAAMGPNVINTPDQSFGGEPAPMTKRNALNEMVKRVAKKKEEAEYLKTRVLSPTSVGSHEGTGAGDVYV